MQDFKNFVFYFQIFILHIYYVLITIQNNGFKRNIDIFFLIIIYLTS